MTLEVFRSVQFLYDQQHSQVNPARLSGLVFFPTTLGRVFSNVLENGYKTTISQPLLLREASRSLGLKFKNGDIKGIYI